MNELAFFTELAAAQRWCGDREGAVLLDWDEFAAKAGDGARGRAAAAAACAAAARAFYAGGLDVAVCGDDYDLHWRHRLGPLIGDRPSASRRLARDGAPVALRAWEEGDLGWVLEACQDPEIARWTNIPWPYGRSAALGLLETSERGRRMGSAALFAVIAPGAEEEQLGSAALTFGGDRIAEVGYWMAAAARGRGAAPAAVGLLVDWAFADLGVARVELKTIVGNRASERVAEKAGFEREGVLRAEQPSRDGGRLDAVMWSRTAPPAAAPGPAPAGTTPPGSA